MALTGHPTRRERAATSIEFVGIAMAATLLLVGVGAALRGDGAVLGSEAGRRIERAVAGSAPRSRPTPPEAPLTATHAAASGAIHATAVSLLQGRARWWHERRRAGGDAPQRVPRDQLRLTPVVDPVAAWSRRWQRAGSMGAVDGRACLLCTALEWSHGTRTGAGHSGGSTDVGVELELVGEGRVALAAADAGVRGARTFGPVATTAQGRVRGMVGTEVDARATLRLGRDEQDVELRGGALAGASARAEGRVGVELLGVAIQQSGRVEGWAGAGARGAAGVHRADSRLEWRLGWGAALGLGGASEWSGSIDVSRVPRRHRALAARALAAGVRSARMSLHLPIPY